MEILEYDTIYDEQIKDLLVELQNYLIDIDDWHTQILSNKYREDCFQMDLELVNKQNGKIYLAIDDNKIIGLVFGIVNVPDEIDKLTNDCAKVGTVLELVIKNSYRGNGIGKLLLNEIENYFKKINCKRINIEVFGPNKNALDFYLKNDYIIRDYIVSKNLNNKSVNKR